MDKQQLKTYIRLHWASLCFLSLGIFTLGLLMYAGVRIFLGQTPNPFNLEFLTFLVLTLWGLELFRVLTEVAADYKRREDKAIKTDMSEFLQPRQQGE